MENQEKTATHPDEPCVMEMSTVQEEVTIDTSESQLLEPERTQAEPVPPTERAVQCAIETFGKYSIQHFQFNSKMIQYYTGFNNFDHFQLFFHSLGPAVNELNYKCNLLDPKDQLFLILMKLRQAKEDIELSLFFGISESTVSKLVVTWINFLYYQLKELEDSFWVSMDVIKQHMPADFSKKFPNTRIILDATEQPIQKPSVLESQSATWSCYKHKNTLKTMVGITPNGAVSFVSSSYGGSTSDRQIIERSSLLDPEKFQSGNSIMADRGIMVQDLFAVQNVKVNTPTFLKGKSQLDPVEVIHDRRIASKRIHVERVIGLVKCFKILKYELPSSKVPLASRIVYVCFAIANFRNCIVDKSA
ncbi:uncharacterized protein LOC134276200 isoform X1 [Saccostrea cucullata]|uniref:uncharacterized protein LOC134276200 isoform X1 n=1 Tax=Saccostrea cuccullata TaxID=36930 RepID=UPI002ED61B95